MNQRTGNMHITIYSLIMTVIWSTLLTAVFAFLKWIRKDYGVCSVPGIITLYAFSVIRLFVPLEMPWTKEIAVDVIYNPFYRFLSAEIGSPGSIKICTYHVIIIIWLTVAFFRVVRLIYNGHSVAIRYRSAYYEADDELNAVLEEVRASDRRRIKTGVFWDNRVSVPVGIGIFHKKILIPKRPYTDEELYFIVKHEYMHMRNKDLLVSFLIEFLCAILWWNPFVYFLKSDLPQIFEIRCDRMVLSGRDIDKGREYIDTIGKVYYLRNRQNNYDYGAVAILGMGRDNKFKENLDERFDLIMSGYNRKDETISVAMTVVSAVIMMVFSYSFVFQSDYDAKIDFEATNEVYEIDATDDFVLHKNDGTYVLITEGENSLVVDSETAEALVENGFKMIGE